MKRLLSAALALALLAIIMPYNAGAADHNAAYTQSCADCHNASLPVTNSTTFNSSCLACHDTNSTNSSVIHRLASTDQANTSHKWSGNAVNPAAGAQAPTTGALAQATTYTDGQLACINCHNPHANNNNVTAFLRINNDSDQICLDCHRSRNVKSHRVDGSQYPASHPVNVKYSDAVAATANGYNNPPLNANPDNPGSDLDAQLTSSNGVVLCSTCHDAHNAYSQSANPPVADSNGKLGDGNLLRTDTRGAKADAGTPDKLNICTNCHAGKSNHNSMGQDIQCLDCHAAHVDYDPNDPTGAKGLNIDLIRRNVTKGGAPSQIFYRYTGSKREYKNADGTGVCQGCHALPDSIADHASMDPAVCNKCHKHNDAKGSFTAAMPDHKADLGSGDIVMFTSDSTHDVTPLSINEECGLCHYGSLVQQHQSKCELCHSGANPPRNSFGGAPWNKTCQQGSCHPTFHGAMTANHNNMYWNSSASCDLCHDTSGGYPGPGDNCARCHTPAMTAAAVGDNLPPVTTSNAQATYVGTASIHLTAIDQGSSGVSNTLYSVNGGRWNIGTDLGLTAPTSGSRAYTLQFYSTDHAMNIETMHSVAITVQAALPALPAAPTGISATAGDAQATISWTAGTGSTSSLIKYGTISGNLTTVIDPATSPRTITGLTNGTTIYYQVGAKNTAGTTWNTTQYSVTPVQALPAAPTGISATAGDTQATISWTAGIGSASSLIRYGTTSGNLTTTIDPATTPQTITGLVNGTAIYYQVGAKNTAGTTWNTTQYSVTPALPLPAAPTGISAVAGDAQATISWTVGTGSTSSLIRYGTSSGNLTTVIDPATAPQTITGLTNGTTIYYQVGAKNTAGTTWNSTQYSITPAPALPAAPTGIAAAAGNAQVTISWTAGTGATSSLIKYGTVSGTYPTTIDPATSPRTITGLTNGTAIYYQVGAKNTTGTVWSGEYSVTPVASSSGAQTWATPGSYTFTVPTGATSLSINALGGGGGGGLGSGPGTDRSFVGATGGNAVVSYQSAVKATATGGLGGKSTTSDWGAAGGAGGTASGTLTAQVITNGTAGSPGSDDTSGDGLGYGGSGGAPNGLPGTDGYDVYDGGGGGGGGGGRVQGLLAVTPGNVVTIVVGTGSSVTINW